MRQAGGYASFLVGSYITSYGTKVVALMLGCSMIIQVRVDWGKGWWGDWHSSEVCSFAALWQEQVLHGEFFRIAELGYTNSTVHMYARTHAHASKALAKSRNAFALIVQVSVQVWLHTRMLTP